MIRVAFCCHGNICRSTLSESVFTHKVNAPESTTEPQRSPNWVEYITVILLAILVGLEIKDKLHKEK